MSNCAVITFVTYLAYQQLFTLIQGVCVCVCVRVRFAVSYNGVKQRKVRDVLEENGAYATVALKRLSRVGGSTRCATDFCVWDTLLCLCMCACMCVCA